MYIFERPYARCTCSIKYDRLHLIKLAALSENIKIKLKIKVKISTYKISFSFIHVVRFWEEDARKDSKRHESASLSTICHIIAYHLQITDISMEIASRHYMLGVYVTSIFRTL